MGIEQKTEVGRQKSEVGGHPSEIRYARHGHEFHWAKRSEDTPVEFPWGNPIQLGKEDTPVESQKILQ